LYDRKVHHRQIRTCDLVLKKAEVSDTTQSRGKLAPNWEGPYRVTNTEKGLMYWPRLREDSCRGHETYQI
ncbi:hypothetical protein GW17_00021117, partial [Ensete ventricosum]